LELYTKWLSPYQNVLFLTCGNWDLWRQIPAQCSRYNIEKPSYFSKYVNIKEIFQNLVGIESKGMSFMLEYFNICLDGNHHCALDDCLNLVKIVAHMNEMIASMQEDISKYYTIKVRR
jgi:inhibitor of KinA sporulation pathway (predicted exonuclease)